ncbi:zinc-binding domain-containing protein [Boeremia exigua]|uniref:zinc-binding domain-containing protein n=1 Tax=Boeremia exigua TaxID=749465 RepID=UPI001E8D8C16|nr:zinc-binding domain-containing protein [Boeremia exigua]KAH6644459.1 zinc-binding domain-containing protein [Boeremia exigua]
MSICTTCNRTFGSIAALQQHEKTSLKHEGTVRCADCNRSFRTENAFKQHLADSPAHRQSSASAIAPSPTPVPVSIPDISSLSITSRPKSSKKSSQQNRTGSQKTSIVIPIQDVQRKVPSDKARDGTLSKSPKVPIPKETKPKQTFYSYPELHQSVAEAVAPDISSTWFNENHRDRAFNNEYATCVKGRFVCDNKACRKHSWGSAVVAILIRGYSRNGYNVVVFSQRCKACDHLGDLTLDKETYVARVAYRLKRWAGVMVEPPPFDNKTTPEHEEKFCEGCKMGICRRAVGVRSY